MFEPFRRERWYLAPKHDSYGWRGKKIPCLYAHGAGKRIAVDIQFPDGALKRVYVHPKYVTDRRVDDMLPEALKTHLELT